MGKILKYVYCGARQIGKTCIIRHVGEKLFENYIEINLLEDSIGSRLFENTRTIEDSYHGPECFMHTIQAMRHILA